MADSPQRKKARVVLKKRLCPHCRVVVSYKTFKAHQRVHYCKETNSWFNVKSGDNHDHNTSSETVDSEVDSEDSSPAEDSPEINDTFFDDYCPGDRSTNESSPPNSDPAASDSSEDSASLDQNYDSGPEIWDTDDSDNDHAYSHEQIESSQEPESPPNSPNINDVLDRKMNSLLKLLVGFLLLLKARFHLSDKLLDLIIRFMKLYFTILGHLCPPLSPLATKFPSTLYAAQKKHMVGRKNAIQIFSVCRKCCSVWKLADCIEGYGNYQKPKACPYISPFSRGKQKGRSCQGILLKTVELATAGNRKVFHPVMTYCYIDLATCLQHLLSRNGFILDCNHWRSRNITTGNLEDVYDGRVWQKFLNYEGKPFLSEYNSLAMMINVDWFQPYKHLTYSVGVIYLTILNLPAHLRYKVENICLIGIIPGPHEPQLNINQYLDPLVNDLLKFWDGVALSVNHGNFSQTETVYCAIICCSCDLPAGRKVCGFLGHAACRGCSKCLKKFPRINNQLDYSGFKRDEWIARTNVSHRLDVEKLKTCKSKTELHDMEMELGCRYSSLLKLPYFDPPMMLVIDPMHNLFLGLAKFFFKKILIGKGLLSEDDLTVIQKRIDKIAAPSNIGRIPYKIASSFHSFTADQYKNWVLHYSVPCLHGFLSSDHFDCWKHLVLACRILTKPSLEKNDVIIADCLILQFCRRTEKLFGKQVVTPNMHMSCHLQECILDYGPLRSFWVFAFERFNGVLGQLPNNNKSIEIQMMKRFLSDGELLEFQLPDDYRQDFEAIMSFQDVHSCVGTLGNELASLSSNLKIKLPSSFTRCMFDSTDFDMLVDSLSKRPECSSATSYSHTYFKYSTIVIDGKTYGSCKSRSKNTSIAFVKHDDLRPVRIKYFCKVNAVGLAQSSLILVCVQWFKELNNDVKNKVGKPVTIWYHDLFDDNLDDFIFTSDIHCRSISLVDTLDSVHGNVLFVSPYYN